jgi:hypothetical protein
MHYFRKLVVCLLTGLVASITLQRIIYRAFWEFRDKHNPPPVFAIGCFVLLMLAVAIYSVVWHRRGKDRTFDTTEGRSDRQRIWAVWLDILSWFIALDLAMFGWQKLFHIQGFVPLARLDEPFSSLTGETLTWAFFGRSDPFFDLIGVLQILGAFFLLFRRSRLFGAVLLFPVMLNIVLINIFYGFEAGDTAHAIILLLGLSYLILRQYRRLAALFFSPEGGASIAPSEGTTPLARSEGSTSLAPVSPAARLILPAAAIVLPLLLVLSFRSPDHNPQLKGKYRVRDLTVNGVRPVDTSCQDSLLTTVYFDVDNLVVLEFNGLHRRWIGNYRLDRSTGAMLASWQYPARAKDTLTAEMTPARPGEWRIAGVLGKDSIRAVLLRE